MQPLTFDQCFDRLIGVEGSYVNDLHDPGGETNWGISKRAYPQLDIRNLTRDAAKAIYLSDFWNRIKADTVLDSVRFQLFDFAVNSGIETTIRSYQRVLNVADDGHFGPLSLEASSKMSEADQLLRLNGIRLDYMTRCKNWQYAGTGWARRIAANLMYAATDNAN